MKNTLLVQSERGNWCIYYRDAKLIPYSVIYYARCVYNHDDKTWIKNTQYSNLPKDISSLPVAEHILSPLGKFVAGLVFDDDYISNARTYNRENIKMKESWQKLKGKLSF